MKAIHRFDKADPDNGILSIRAALNVTYKKSRILEQDKNKIHYSQSQLESDKNCSTAVVELNQMALTRTRVEQNENYISNFIFYEKQSIKII